MEKTKALPLQYSRIKRLLPDAELIRLAEKVKGKALSAVQKQDRNNLVDNILMAEISKFASCMYGKGWEQYYDHNLYRAVQKTAELLGLGTRGDLESLSNEEICDKIQFVLNVSDYERILHLSEKERILTLRTISPQVVKDVSPTVYSSSSSYDRLPKANYGFFYDPFNALILRAALTPESMEILKQGGQFVGKAVLSGDAAKFLKEKAPAFKAQVTPKAGKWVKDIAKGGLVFIGIAAAIGIGVGVYNYVEPKIREKQQEKERKMVHVIAELVACLCFNPYSVFNLDQNSAYEIMRRAYVTELNKVHPDLVVGLSAEEQASAYQRMKELIIAWEIIQTEKGIHSLP